MQSEKIKAAVVEVVDDLVDQDDQKPVSETINDAEATAALETVHDETLDLPVVERADLAPQWQGDKPVFCVAGRGPLDEAAAIMLAQLLEKHGLGARVEGADAVAISNIFRLDTAGIGMACLSYLDAGSPARMRYAIRRMRRRLPQAQILLGCWRADTDTTTIRDTAKPDAVATTLREAVKLCLEAARNSRTSSLPMEVQQPDANADAA